MRLIDPRLIWNRRYEKSREQDVQPDYDPWLERWVGVLNATKALPVLDLGCGGGFDTRYLTEKGFYVVAGDFAREGLRVARKMAAQAEMVEIDVREGLPFAEESFQVIVANLSLHYFRWGQTRMVFGEVRKRLKSGGHLLTRVNSSNDYQYGAASGQLVERNCRIVNGVLKRYFEKGDIDELFRDGWNILDLKEQVVHRYNKPKVLWEIVAQKT